MKTMHTIGVIACFILVLAANSFAQTTGDYRSAAPAPAGGLWTVKTSWQTYNGTAWVAAAAAPTGSENITIQATDSVDVNAPTTITGKITGLGGKLGNSSTNLTFGNNGIYEHAINVGSLPVATWGTGSTCLITGTIGAAPSNCNQNFYNFSWNCPQYQTAVNLAWGGNTIRGDVKIKGSVNRTYLRMTNNNIGNAAPGANVITINGNILLENYEAAFTSTGSSGGDTIEVYVKGNITSNGLFNLANGSGTTCKWFVSGDVNILGGQMTTNSNTTSLPDSFIFVGTTKQTFYKADSISSIANVQFALRPSAIVDLSTTSIGGTISSFTQPSGTTLLTGHPKGLKGNLSMGGAIKLPVDGNYEYNGVVDQLDSLLPVTVKNLTINNPTSVAFSQAITVNGILALKKGNLNNSVNAIHMGAGGSVVITGGTSSLPIGTAVDETPTAPGVYKLYSNYPNPFNPTTNLQFSVAKDGFATLRVFNLLGQEAATLYEGYARTGNKITVTFNAGNLPSGIYIAQLEQNGMRSFQRMMLLK
ncbi:MAG: T9SS type A sorting domain-containing protein [Ignavibacteriales bacterium]|nr:T9SS type A sorting domain-containing protein [Ignavibacteriales bacterium]